MTEVAVKVIATIPVVKRDTSSMGSTQSNCPRQQQGVDPNQQSALKAIHSNQEQSSGSPAKKATVKSSCVARRRKSRCWSLLLAIPVTRNHVGVILKNVEAEPSYKPATTKQKCVLEETQKLLVENNNVLSFGCENAAVTPTIASNTQCTKETTAISGIKKKKESRLTRRFTALNFGNMKNTVKNGCSDNADATSVQRNSSMPSMIAGTVVGKPSRISN
uniref:Uncharacterized protein n=1 Tax=Ditylenchus dipsaci TaxID=166011 RepID=A0A915DR87_9BILA